MQNKLRKLIHKTGIDLHKYHPEIDRLNWTRDLNIKSVFDIGANIGQFATEIRAALPQAQIYSFEPIRECYQALIEDMNGDAAFTAFNVALGDVPGKMTMNKSSYTPSSSLRPMAPSHKELFPHTAQSTTEEIVIEKLDDMYATIRPADNLLIKVDTQGYEDKVIAGGMQAFKQAKVVLIEASFVQLYEGQPLFDDIYAKMKSFGLSYRGALHQKINKQTGEVIFEDAIFVR